MTSYQLSHQADRDFEHIFEYGIDNFGLAQAIDYAKGMKAQFAKLSKFPAHYQKVSNIHPGLRRCVYRKHTIYFEELVQGILILRILRSQDLLKSLNEVEPNKD